MFQTQTVLSYFYSLEEENKVLSFSTIKDLIETIRKLAESYFFFYSATFLDCKYLKTLQD